jgi:hypothetical protein
MSAEVDFPEAALAQLPHRLVLSEIFVIAELTYPQNEL